MNGSEAIGNNSLIKEGTLLTLIAENTEAEQLSSLTANGNPIRFQTTGYLNMGGHVLNVPTQFAATFTPNRYAIRIDTPQGGTLSATIDGVPVLSGSVYPHGSDIRITARTRLQAHTYLGRAARYHRQPENLPHRPPQPIRRV